MSMCCEYFVFYCPMQYGWTSLHLAAHSGHLHLVKKLIKVCGMPPDQQSKVQVDCLCVYIRGHVCCMCVCWQHYLPCMVWSRHHLTLCSPPHLVAPLDSTVRSSMGRTWGRGPVPAEGAWMQPGDQRCGMLWVGPAGFSEVACWFTRCCFLSFLSLVPPPCLSYRMVAPSSMLLCAVATWAWSSGL